MLSIPAREFQLFSESPCRHTNIHAHRSCALRPLTEVIAMNDDQSRRTHDRYMTAWTGPVCHVSTQTGTEGLNWDLCCCRGLIMYACGSGMLLAHGDDDGEIDDVIGFGWVTWPAPRKVPAVVSCLSTEHSAAVNKHRAQSFTRVKTRVLITPRSFRVQSLPSCSSDRS